MASGIDGKTKRVVYGYGYVKGRRGTRGGGGGAGGQLMFCAPQTANVRQTCDRSITGNLHAGMTKNLHAGMIDNLHAGIDIFGGSH